MRTKWTAIIYREGEGFVALCPELDIASQGDTVEAARDNLREALEVAQSYASEPEGWLVLTGDYGVGKTHLAAAIEGRADFFCTCDDRLLRRARALATLATRAVTPEELIAEMPI